METAAIYCRLSKEDDDKERTEASESIQNQEGMLLQYARERGWSIADVYIDDDYSGTDRSRPAFNRMLTDARQGKFRILLVKTQSRFSRDMELVERYIHGKFPEWGVRFVAPLDNIDTAVRGNKKTRQINALVDEWYVESLSESVRGVFDHKRREGQYIGGFPVYGYRKHPEDKHRLVIEPESAEVVRRIYRWYLDGCGTQRIARRLNEEGTPNPTRWKQLQGLGYVNGAARNALGLWSRTSVARILRDRMYTGDMVQGKREKVSYKSKKLRSVPPERWIVVEGTHEAVIERDTFETVQRMLGERTRSDGTGETHLLAGRCRCMDCGSAMSKTSQTYKGVRHSYLRCKLYAADRRQCAGHFIRLDALEELVTERMRAHIRRVYDPAWLRRMEEERRREGKAADLEREAARLECDIDGRSRALRRLYLDRASGTIGEEDYRDFAEVFAGEREALERRLAQVRADRESLTAEDGEALADKAEEWLFTGAPTRELVAEMIDMVEIGAADAQTGEQEVRIRWRF